MKKVFDAPSSTLNKLSVLFIHSFVQSVYVSIKTCYYSDIRSGESKYDFYSNSVREYFWKLAFDSDEKKISLGDMCEGWSYYLIKNRLVGNQRVFFFAIFHAISIQIFILGVLNSAHDTFGILLVNDRFVI